MQKVRREALWYVGGLNGAGGGSYFGGVCRERGFAHFRCSRAICETRWLALIPKREGSTEIEP